MSFDKIFDLTAGVYFNFYNIPGTWNGILVCIGKRQAGLLLARVMFHRVDVCMVIGDIRCWYDIVNVFGACSIFFCRA